MVDELKVKCPYHEDGCKETSTRGDIQDHVEKYCDYAEVQCPSEECHLLVPRKDIKRGCLHYPVTCVDCNLDLTEKELEAHRRKDCQQRKISCLDCEVELIRCDLNAHIEDCPEAILRCPGAPYGCDRAAKRKDLDFHIAICPIAVMGPFLKIQNDRLAAQELAVEHLQRKNEVLEGGLSSIQAILSNSSSDMEHAFPSYSASVLPELSPSLAASHTSEAPPFDSAIHHLLSLHESLREEVDRSSVALSELDAKTSMMVMNQDLRTKEDMAHTNAVVNSMRMQLQWLTSAMLQNQPRSVSGTSVAGSSTGPRGGGGSGGPGGAAGSGPQPIRRMSGTTPSISPAPFGERLHF
ncbi:MAG: hypothetical protein M1827_002411 [Pycnora praestabilis]|nr:MAG: hypothetical protein M1827_002411 [Pycnora praestabilis]